MASSSPWRRCAGSDGAESQYCDLSGRGFSADQVDRTLRVFAMADTIDLSNNEIEKIPLTIPTRVMTLDMSFNTIASIQGIERLKFVQELHLAFNRLDDASLLEYCPRLVRVNLSGNRLSHTEGLETLELLESLDISDNLIELFVQISEALRALSLNENLTQLSIRGNPISQRLGYHIPILDMIPSLIMLDDKKMRNPVRVKTRELSSTKSLSYSRIYDDKKQFVIHQQTRTPSQPRHLRSPASKFDATMFCPSPVHEYAQVGEPKYQNGATPIAPPRPLSSSIHNVPNSSSKRLAAPYMSTYDRLAQSNGASISRPVSPAVKPIPDSKLKKSNVAAMTRSCGNARNVLTR